VVKRSASGSGVADMNPRTLLGRVIAGLLLLAVPNPARAITTQNFSGLQDKTLTLETNAADLLMNAAMGGTCQGTFSRVQVTKDTETQLSVSVSYTGFGSCFLTARLADRGKGIRGFEPVVQSLSDGGSVELNFTITPGSYGADQEIRAPKLYLTVGQTEKATRYYRATFNLNKKFKIASTLTDVTATPLGAAAHIAQATAPPTPETQVMPRIKLYTKLERAPVAAEAVPTRSLYLKNVEPAKLNVVGSAATDPTVRVAAPRMISTRSVIDARSVAVPSRVIAQPPPQGQPPAPTPQPPNTTPQGPDDKALPLFENLVTDYDFEYPFQITNIRLDVYPDKNKTAGVYYFVPAAYNLLYDSDRGFQFVIDYGTSGSDDSSNTVRMSGKLSPGIGKKEIDVVEELVKAYVHANAQLGYPQDRCELRALQITGSPTVSFDTDLKQYNITNQTVNATSLTEPVDVSWRTDQANATDLSNSLKANVGIIGTMTLKPQGGTLTDQTIPVRIRLADERTLGRFTLTTGWRGRNWTNSTPYPVKLKNLHVLWVNGNTPAVYTWQLGDREIEPGAQAHWIADAIPAWLDGQPYARFWLEYEVENCEPCHDAVLRTIIHSTVQAQAQQIKFKLLSFFQDFHLNSMVINVRTKQADAAGDAVQALPPIEVGADAHDYMSGKIYVPRGESAAFEYQIQLILEDGTLRQSSWMPRSDLIVPIGKSQIKELFPQLATP
jgi:hypothetical protein